MSTSRCPNPSKRKSGLLSLSIAIAIFLLMSFISLAASRVRWASLPSSAPNPVVRLGHADASVREKAVSFNEKAFANAAPSSTPPVGESEQSPPENIPNQMAGTQAPSSTSDRWIHFDDMPHGTPITNQYSPAVFSSDPAHFCVANSDSFYGSSFPNRLTRGPSNPANYGYAPVYVNFTSPVNSLRFLMLAADANSSNIAQLNIYQNHKLAATRALPGFGNPFSPILINIGVANGGMGFDNVTRIEIVNIIDPAGLSFDDFMFTIAPTPTPTPTPIPSPTPFPPTNLIAESDKIVIRLTWGGSGATSFNVKRRTTTTGWSTIATAGPATQFDDATAIPDETYFYAVSARNGALESADSNVVSATIVPSCGYYVGPRPAPQHYPDPGNGWSLNTDVSDRDGLVLTDISLNGRYMAKMMSVPYFFVKTSKMAARQRGELTPDSEAFTMRARLKRFWTSHGIDITQGGNYGTRYIAEYTVDRLTPTSKSCLYITQEYVFQKQRPNDKCEPSGTMPCSRFYPKVSYRFEGRVGETLESVNIPVRLHYRVSGASRNTIGLFRDQDSVISMTTAGDMFVDKRNPLVPESEFRVVRNGFDNGLWDNIHQTNNDIVSHPPHDAAHGVYGGCPECVHTHWRWGSFYRKFPFFFDYGTGIPLVGINANIFTPTNQDLDLAIVRYKAGEEHPGWDYTSLIEKNPPENIRDWVTQAPPVAGRRTIRVWGPAEVVYWYSGTSYEPKEDLFFKHGSFYNPKLHQDKTAANATGSAANSAQAVQDGVRSITYAHVYKEGATTFTNVDLSTVPPLPPGYVALDNRAHRIATEAMVSGPHVVSFDVPSVNDQAVFNDLAIFHLEMDPFDPDNMVWVDDTILSPDTPAPDFTNRIVNARVNDVGYFAIGKLVQPQPDPGSSDLSVTVTASSSSVVVENNLSYAVHVTNSGPQPSNGVGIVNVLPQEATFVSVSSSQGTCKHKNGSVYCKLGTLASGGSADVTIVVNTFEDRTGIPSQGRSIVNTAVVAGNNDDTNLENNSATNSVSLLLNPNPRPLVNITSPSGGTTYAPSTAVNVIATATDTNGSISRVDFFDGGTLIGTGTAGAGNKYHLTFVPSSGPHSIVAVATDNGGRTASSDSVNIFVNGSGNITITSPSANAVFDPSSTISVTANATGSVSKVEFFANSIPLGEVSGGSPYSVTWTNIPAGSYTLTAVVTDASGSITTSAPVNIAVTSKPAVAILSPVDGMSYAPLSRVAIMATAQDTDGFVSKVDFYANGTLIGAGSLIGQDKFTVDWTDVPTGIHSLTAIATDNLGVSATSPAITIGVNTPSPQPGEFIWFDDALPLGALTPAGQEGWYWVDANPGAFSGTKAHQSLNFAAREPWNGLHQHYFDGATTTLPVSAGDKLFTYVFLDINNMPREIMLQWKDANSWEHRAYWGANLIPLGTDGTDSRRYMGPLPRANQWVRLEVPANLVGLEGATLNGMAFTLDGGRATWDLAGKTAANAPPPPATPPGDFIWVDDAVPAGSTLETVDDQWQWIEPHVCGTQGHRSFFTVNQGAGKFRSHSFRNASTTMSVNPGDVLFTYVYLDANHMPDQLMIQWHDGTGWEHRAFWGENYIGQKIPNMGVQGTESQRYMGGIPPGNQWVRLEVPASYVGLEGKTVSGMAFGFYSRVDKAGINWDCSGKSPNLTTVPLPLSATSSVWRLYSNTYGWSYNTNDQGEPEHIPQKKDVFFVHPNEAAGTVPMHRFRKSGYEYFYTRCRNCPGSEWQYEGIAFYVYPDATSPGTVPLYLYHDDRSKYFLTINQNEAAGMTFDGIWGYVYSVNPMIPAPPTLAAIAGCSLNWRDNSATETGFRIEERNANTGSWSQIGTAAANANAFCVAGDLCNQPGLCMSTGSYRVQAFNAFGNSIYSNVATYNGETSAAKFAKEQSSEPSTNSQPTVDVVNPSVGYVTEDDLAITANAFDGEGNGTIVNAEIFANGSRLGEATDAPSVFSEPVVSPPTVDITAPANGDLVEPNFAIFANAFDIDGNGTITKVEFFANGNKLGEIWDAPYIFVWNNAPAGTYSLTAKATDAAAASTTSASVSVTVDTAPTVSITSPASGAVFNAPAAISINAAAFDEDGSISKVEFFQGSIKLGEVTTAPYSFDWNAVAAGSYVLTAVATDNLGRATVSSPVSISVNAPPAVSITSPAGGTAFTAPADLTINANASDSDGTISTVEFYQGATLLGTRTTSPYSLTWTNAPSGSYSLTAKATDNLGAVTTSTPVSIIVNALPNVSISSPASGTTFFAPASISINAVASDDGGISKVEFFQGATLLGTDTTSPYSFNWIHVPIGSYSLTAKATDNLGATATSNIMSIFVVQGSTSNKIAFASNRDGSAQIYSMNSDGSSIFRLTTIDANDEAPKWSPNNSRIVFQSDRDNPFSDVFDIYSMNSDGSAQTRLTTNINDNRAPVWSPDGTRIAFQSRRNGVNYQVYVMNADGSGQVNISNSTSNDTQPSWSPDGTKIAFASDRDQAGFPSIYVMNADGSNQTRLTSSSSGFHDDQPAWSPDGTKLAFISTRDSALITWEEWILGEHVVKTKLLINKEVYVMNADGSGQVRLTNVMGNDDSPVWSSDGTRIAFRSDRDRDCCDPYEQVWVMNADGSNQVNLSNSQFGDHCPSWSR